MTKSIKITVWDKTNNFKMQEYSNPPLGCKIEIDLEECTMKLSHKAGINTVADICSGDVFEIRVERM